uniref:Uncharacterized protein n=1 Tax=Oryza punctata TaxID=4537 RepID=A0A0E0KZP1_ORYPU
MEENDDTVVFEAKVLLQASMPDAGQHLHQQGDVHLCQEQELATAPRPTFTHRAPCSWLQRIGWSQLVMKVVYYFSFARRLYNMNENGAFMRVNLFHLNEQMWEVRSKWKTS